MSAALYMDENVPCQITTGLRLRDMDVLTIQGDSRASLSDPEVLDRATELNRTHLPLKIMTAAEKLYQLIQTLPENQINEVLNFAEFLQHKQLTAPPLQPIPSSTFAGPQDIANRTNAIQQMRGLLKTDQPAPADEDVAAMLEARRVEKYI